MCETESNHMFDVRMQSFCRTRGQNGWVSGEVKRLRGYRRCHRFATVKFAEWDSYAMFPSPQSLVRQPDTRDLSFSRFVPMNRITLLVRTVSRAP